MLSEAMNRQSRTQFGMSSIFPQQQLMGGHSSYGVPQGFGNRFPDPTVFNPGSHGLGARYQASNVAGQTTQGLDTEQRAQELSQIQILNGEHKR
jgi:hypothetical protein